MFIIRLNGNVLNSQSVFSIFRCVNTVGQGFCIKVTATNGIDYILGIYDTEEEAKAAFDDLIAQLDDIVKKITEIELQ